jgi:hypothetical protein
MVDESTSVVAAATISSCFLFSGLDESKCGGYYCAMVLLFSVGGGVATVSFEVRYCGCKGEGTDNLPSGISSSGWK